MTEKWGTRRGFIKLHVGVDARTKKIYAVVITDDKCGDSPQFEEPAEPAEQAFANAEKSSSVNTPADPMIAADGAYDTRKIRRYCSEKGIAPQIPIRINFSGNSGGCASRKEAGFMQLGGFDHIDKKTEHEFADLTRQQKRERQKVWRKESGYNDRWSVEIAFSTFKRIFGECMNTRKWENVKMEIYGKVCLYNHMIDMAIEGGYGTPRIVYLPGKPSSKTARREERQ